MQPKWINTRAIYLTGPISPPGVYKFGGSHIKLLFGKGSYLGYLYFASIWPNFHLPGHGSWDSRNRVQESSVQRGQGDSTQGRGFGQRPREAEAESRGFLKTANTYSYSKDRVIDPSLLVRKMILIIDSFCNCSRNSPSPLNNGCGISNTHLVN